MTSKHLSSIPSPRGATQVSRAEGASLPPVTDFYLPAQWHFSEAAGADVLPVLSTYRGAGVRVAVIDGGIDLTHPDLAPNYDAAHSAVFMQPNRGAASSADLAHGTAVAGVIAAAANGYGAVGVASSVSLAMLQVQFGPATDLTDFAAAIRATLGFDVANNSWSITTPFDLLRETPETASALLDALGTAATAGRSGLGTIEVFAAGNAGADHDATNYHALQGSRFALTVGSYGPSGAASSFTTPGASVLIAAPGENILTDDLLGPAGWANGDVTMARGTSFAAPIVAGIVALMLEANPGLGARDVHEILAYTARPLSAGMPANAAADWNGGGLQFSLQTGFGAVDAAAAVRLAEAWSAVPHGGAHTFGADMQSTTSPVEPMRYNVPDSGWTEIALTLSDHLRIDKMTLNLYLENVSARTLDLVLVSPSGTECHLTNAAASADSSLVSGQWSFSANAFWSEDAAGVWMLKVHDVNADAAPDLESGSLSNITLSAFGDAESAATRFIYTDAFSSLSQADPSRSVLAFADGLQDTLDVSPMSKAVHIELSTSIQVLNSALLQVMPNSLENSIGGAGNDTIGGSYAANILWGGWGNDNLDGGFGNDVLRGGTGNDLIDGGSGSDTADFSGSFWNYCILSTGRGGYFLQGPDGLDCLQSIEALRFDTGQQINLTNVPEVVATSTLTGNGDAGFAATSLYVGPVTGLTWQVIGTSQWENIVVPEAAFVNGGAGDDAVLGSVGNDVLDGGTGSNFLTGGGGNDVFFLDGRGGTTTWSTIADWHAGDQLSLWGWRPGISKVYWNTSDGAPGWTGATMHADLNADGQADTAVTWTGLDRSQLPSTKEYDGLLWFT